MKKYVYDGKKELDILNNAMYELNVNKEDILYQTKEETSGLFKSKKYIVEIFKKSEIVSYVKDLVLRITKELDSEVNLEVLKTEETIKINIYTSKENILIGRNGRTIDALQQYVRQVIFVKTGYHLNIIIDVAAYKVKKEKQLEKLAIRLAKEVRKTKVDVKMDSMNSYQRRIVHNTLTNFKGVTTVSEGEEPNRYVVIKVQE